MASPTDEHLPPSPHPLVRVESLTRNYAMGANVVQALRGVDLSVQRGELAAVLGPYCTRRGSPS
jgi:ABC-type glutathione transport system ATPase component